MFSGLDQRAAALGAGYLDGPGLTVTASRLMNDPAVRAELGRLRALAEAQSIAAKDEALKLLTEQMRANWSDFMSMHEHVDLDGKGTGEFYPLIDMAKAAKAGKLHLIHSFEVTQHGVKVKLADSQGAMDRLARLLGWNAAEKVDVKTTSVDPAALSESELDALIKAELGRRGKA